MNHKAKQTLKCVLWIPLHTFCRSFRLCVQCPLLFHIDFLKWSPCSSLFFSPNDVCRNCLTDGEKNSVVILFSQMVHSMKYPKWHLSFLWIGFICREPKLLMTECLHTVGCENLHQLSTLTHIQTLTHSRSEGKGVHKQWPISIFCSRSDSRNFSNLQNWCYYSRYIVSNVWQTEYYNWEIVACDKRTFPFRSDRGGY